jgi:acetyl esterase/lipase
LPALQILDLSHNALTTIDLSNPIPPSEEGLSYGAGFLSTSFSRAKGRSPLTVWPSIRNLNLGHNRLTNDGLKGLNVITRLSTMRILNLERNSLTGLLNLDSIGAGIDDMPELTSLVLSGNARLRGSEGDISEMLKIELEGCGIGLGGGGGQPRTVSALQRQAGKQAVAGSGDLPTPASAPAKPKAAGNGSGIPLPDITMTYRTCPAATFDSEPLAIQFDLYLPETPPASSTGLPLIIWFHGGGLLQGNKENLPPHLRRLPKHAFASPKGNENVAVLSPNYRLAPQVPIIDILSDISTLLNFVQLYLNKRLTKEGKGEFKIDTQRICLSGGSAGGYLAMIAGLNVPKSANDESVGGYRGDSEKGIKCIAPFYPITDLTDEFWSTETNPVPWYGRV